MCADLLFCVYFLFSLCPLCLFVYCFSCHCVIVHVTACNRCNRSRATSRASSSTLSTALASRLARLVGVDEDDSERFAPLRLLARWLEDVLLPADEGADDDDDVDEDADMERRRAVAAARVVRRFYNLCVFLTALLEPDGRRLTSTLA